MQNDPEEKALTLLELKTEKQKKKQLKFIKLQSSGKLSLRHGEHVVAAEIIK